jgi:hypothetical protein
MIVYNEFDPETGFWETWNNYFKTKREAYEYANRTERDINKRVIAVYKEVGSWKSH